MRESIKSFKKMVVSGTPEVAEKSLSTLYKAIDKAAKRGVIKKKTASRKKSRIIALLRKQTVK